MSDHDWSDSLSAADRIEAVAVTVSDPRTANWIATEADVAHETATKYLQRLTEDGKLKAETQGEQTTYRPDPVGQYLIEMRELYEDHSPDQLAESLEAMNEQIRAWKTDYNVETPNELRASLSRVEDTDKRERQQAAREWDHLVMRRRLVEDALQRSNNLPGDQQSMST